MDQFTTNSSFKVSENLCLTLYKSGGTGKCIQFGEEWLTPTAFETKSGSK